MPEVSVVLPTRLSNVAYFNEALRSILNQSVSDIEVIVIFDGCPMSRVYEALADLGDDRVRAVVSAKRRGLARILNIGIRLSRASFIARMDDDDRSLPGRFEKQIALLSDRNVDVVGTWCWDIDADGRRLAAEPSRPDPSLPLSPVRAVFGYIFTHPSVMMRREWAGRNRYDPTWGNGQDRELWVRAAPKSVYSCVEEPLIEYRKAHGVKPERMGGVVSAYRLIWRNRSTFGIWVPVLFALNATRQAIYWIRIKLRRKMP